MPVSFEFFPPKSDEGQTKLLATATELDQFSPDFVSVTYGAGGSDRHRTETTVVRLSQQMTAPVMPHLTCVAHTRKEVQQALTNYRVLGINHILALGGDMPSDGGEYSSDYSHAEELVETARSLGEFRIGVAAHPEKHPDSPDMESDRKFLAQKLKLANFAVTQFFFDTDHYKRLVDDLSKLGVDKPIIPGVLPINNIKGLNRMAALNGTNIPDKLQTRLRKVEKDPKEVEKVGVEVASKITEELVYAGAPAIHMYTMNRADLVSSVLQNVR